MDITVHFQPLADQIYIYVDGSYADRSDHIVTMAVTYSHQGERCYISNIKCSQDCENEENKFTKQVWSKLREAFASRGLLLVEYEHKGKDISVDLITGKSKIV